ncbi:unnamed protein product, partial [Mesorhabditis belari]|uniref:ubiquitinyl hydrolase 1 n=1 Tax=Mesorhabditis belari TaxID=2138241 RepID=A0AAF3EAS7_9BILA
MSNGWGVYPAGTLNGSCLEKNDEDLWERINEELDLIQMQQNKPKKPREKETLINVNGASTSKKEINRQVDNVSMRITMVDVSAHRFTFRISSKPTRISVEVVAGSIIQPVTALDNKLIVASLEEIGKGERVEDPVYGRVSEMMDTYVVVAAKDTLAISRQAGRMLIPLSNEERHLIASNQKRLSFLENLIDGQAVLYLNKEGELVNAQIASQILKGDILFFNLEIDGIPKKIETTAARIYPRKVAMKIEESRAQTSNGAPVVRNVPIKILETGFEPEKRSYPNSFHDDLRKWNGDPFTSGPTPVAPPRKSRGSKEIPSNDQKSEHQSSASSSGDMTSVGRSKSAHSGMAQHVVHSKSLSQEESEFKVGDRVLWKKDRNDEQKATLRWIGHLRGYSSLYAGVEFDQPIGQGTGTFKGESIFKTEPGYAGFLLLSVLIKIEEKPKKGYNDVKNLLDIAIPVEPSTSHQRNYHEDYKKAANSRNSPSLEPFSHRSKKPMPRVAPRPQMRPEDFLIDSYAPGACVEVVMNGSTRWGVIRWAGDCISLDSTRLEKSAQVELETDPPTDWRLAAECNVGEVIGETLRTVLVPQSALRRDRRFDSNTLPQLPRAASSSNLISVPSYSSECVDSGVEVEPQVPTLRTENLIGTMKGIQGSKNSCYLDSTLYAMFAQCRAFDTMLTREMMPNDIAEYNALRKTLAYEIVYPLRKRHFVRADHIMKFRGMLAKVLTTQGLTSEEQDPEEILNGLFEKVFRVEPFIELVSQENVQDKRWVFQILLDNAAIGGVTTTQHLLEKTMKEANVRFRYAPRVLCLQLPRHGKQKLYDRIVPLEKIDITPLVRNALVPCGDCGRLAEVFCPTCFLTNRVLLSDVSKCLSCFQEAHMDESVANHQPRYYYPPVSSTPYPQRFILRLRSVISIESSHYVSFVRSDNRFLFFDSMADRHGGPDGYNIPTAVECPTLKAWLSMDGWKRTEAMEEHLKAGVKNVENDRFATRLMGDAYICIYELQGQPLEEKLISL